MTESASLQWSTDKAPAQRRKDTRWSPGKWSSREWPRDTREGRTGQEEDTMAGTLGKSIPLCSLESLVLGQVEAYT